MQHLSIDNETFEIKCIYIYLSYLASTIEEINESTQLGSEFRSRN